MKTIKFTQNWALKLDNKKFFTTIRLNKQYYQIGESYIIELKDKRHGVAKIKTINTALLENLPDFLCFSDTGYTKTETQNILRKMYPQTNWDIQNIAIILLEWINKY